MSAYSIDSQPWLHTRIAWEEGVIKNLGAHAPSQTNSDALGMEVKISVF
jgi:hypothetical protein